jgi:pimeloyl-ACP methyl ester carboxylesterase
MADQGSATTRDGRKLTYRLVGSGPVLLCHPGGPGFSAAYFENLAGLDADRTLVLVNPAGTGGSDPWTEEAYSLTRRADDLDDLRATLGEDRVDYLGHSAGGFVGVRFASAYPQSVRRLVLVGTFARFSDELRTSLVREASRNVDEPWFADAVTAAQRRGARDYADDTEFEALYVRAFPLMFGRFGDKERAFLDRLRAANEATPDRRTLESFNAQVANFDLRDDLERIEAPTLVVNGELEGNRAVEHELLERIPDVRLAVVEGAGHFSFAEQPARFRAAVLPFLSE